MNIDFESLLLLLIVRNKNSLSNYVCCKDWKNIIERDCVIRSRSISYDRKLKSVSH